ncbi:MAG TPA: Gldg family protein [Kofleriaceae bacterium]
MRTMYWVLRRELAVTLRAPILYVIGGLFLVVQGIAFAGLVGEMSDPRRPAPLGALLEGQLAGTLLTWVLQLVVLTLLGMRAIADERRSGGWELLVTAGVSEAAAVIGKWLAATIIYALLWLPTLAYLGVIAAFRSDAGGWDLATIACGYAGAIALGAALLAWAIAASAATSTPLAAGGLGFALLVGLFLVGEIPTVWPGANARVFAALGLRAHLTSFARGQVGAGDLEFVVALAATGLSLAITLACAGRRKAREVGRRVASTVLLAAIGVLAGALAVQHPVAWDLSAAHRNSLDPETRAVLAELPGPATLTIVEPTLGALDALYDEVARVADRMADSAPVQVRRLDPTALPGGLKAAARLAGVQPKDLAENGGVVVELGGKQRVVDVLQLATIDRGTSGAPEFERLAVEQAIAGALAELSTAVPATVCATTGHDELSMSTAAPNGADWTLVANRLAAAGVTVRELASTADLAGCAAVIVAGPTKPLSPEDALALQRYVARGGGLVVAAASRPVPNGPQLAATGLEPVLAAEGLGLPLAIAVDPSLAIREVPGALMVVDGYAEHSIERSGSAGPRSAPEGERGESINAGFAGARRTLWFQPRVVVATGAAKPLVSASPQSWGERDLVHGPPAKDPDDLAGPVVLAAVGGTHRVIAIGSAESFTTAALAGGASAADLWLERAVRFAAGQSLPQLARGRAAGQVRLVMTPDERRTVIALCVAGIPLVWLLLGGAVLALRRRS